MEFVDSLPGETRLNSVSIHVHPSGFVSLSKGFRKTLTCDKVIFQVGKDPTHVQTIRMRQAHSEEIYFSITKSGITAKSFTQTLESRGLPLPKSFMMKKLGDDLWEGTAEEKVPRPLAKKGRKKMPDLKDLV